MNESEHVCGEIVDYCRVQCDCGYFHSHCQCGKQQEPCVVPPARPLHAPKLEDGLVKACSCGWLGRTSDEVWQHIDESMNRRRSDFACLAMNHAGRIQELEAQLRDMEGRAVGAEAQRDGFKAILDKHGECVGIRVHSKMIVRLVDAQVQLKVAQQAVEDLHEPTRDDNPHCEECGEAHPCQSVRAVRGLPLRHSEWDL